MIPGKLLIIGGVAGGATAAARARRLSESTEIILIERGNDISFANCGLPYHIGGEIKERSSLIVQPKETLAKRFNLDIRTRTDALRIDIDNKTVCLKSLDDSNEYTETYSKLILAPGAKPFVPPILGIGNERICTLRNMTDMDRIKDYVDNGAKSVLVVGGGFIGLELAENFSRRGLSVTLVELMGQVMAPLDAEMTSPLVSELLLHGVDLRLSDSAKEFQAAENAVQVRFDKSADASFDFVVMAIGVRPESDLARDAGLSISDKGAIIVDQHMMTSDPCVYAVGDVVEVRNKILDSSMNLPLAGPANRQARVAVDHIFGHDSKYSGVLGTSVVRVFDQVAAITGASEKVLKSEGIPYEKVYVVRGQHVGYFPGSSQMVIKLVFAPSDGMVLGAQIVGQEGVDKRIDVLATALYSGLSIYDLQDLELAYAPQFGAAKDPVNIAGYVAVNALEGHESFVFPQEFLEEKTDKFTILDVREVDEAKEDEIPNSILIPLGELRNRINEIPKELPVAAYCGVGQRAYYATRVLRDGGFQALNIAGGLVLWRMVHRKC